MFKKRIKFLLVALLVFFMYLSQHSIYVRANSNRIKLNEDNVEEIIAAVTLDWVQMIEPDLDFIVGDIVRIVVPGSDELEYTASIFYKAIPYGYVVLSFEGNDVIVKEASISKGQEGIYADIIEEIDKKEEAPRLSLKVEEIITRIAPLQYGLNYVDNNGNSNLVDNQGNDLSDEQSIYCSTKYSSAWSIYIDNANWTSSNYEVNESSKIILDKFTKKPQLISEPAVENITGKYACGVQALTQIAYMEGLTRYGRTYLRETYNKLWEYTNTTETSESKKATDSNVIYGGGSMKDAAKGFIEFAQEKGYTGTEYKGIKYNPSVAWIKDKLEYNRPILMGYGIDVNGSYSGHFISILGYMKAKKVSSGNTWNYLMVYNGWDDTVSYLNYSCVDFIDCEATYFWVKK